VRSSEFTVRSSDPLVKAVSDTRRGIPYELRRTAGELPYEPRRMPGSTDTYARRWEGALARCRLKLSAPLYLTDRPRAVSSQRLLHTGLVAMEARVRSARRAMEAREASAITPALIVRPSRRSNRRC